MKISICIPQYNRIDYLLKSLEIIAEQDYGDIEIVISDDCSTDETESQIKALIGTYTFPIVYKKSETNLGYDRNLRQAMELASGDYCFVLGNDDTLNGTDAISKLVKWLNENETPDIGFCNYADFCNNTITGKRAFQDTVLGKGKAIALQYYSCFSFVAGLIYKRDTFIKYNTDKFDGSIYVQIYLAILIISGGNRLFSLKDVLVLKDITIDNDKSNSYRDFIPKKWKDFKQNDGGMLSVINVLTTALIDTGNINQNDRFQIFKKIYLTTLPFWILDYKSNKALPASVGLILGTSPFNSRHYNDLNFLNRILIFSLYLTTSFWALLLPYKIFLKLKDKLYEYFKR